MMRSLSVSLIIHITDKMAIVVLHIICNWELQRIPLPSYIEKHYTRSNDPCASFQLISQLALQARKPSFEHTKGPLNGAPCTSLCPVVPPMRSGCGIEHRGVQVSELTGFTRYLLARNTHSNPLPRNVPQNNIYSQKQIDQILYNSLLLHEMTL